MHRCAEAEVSRWITAQFTCTQAVVRTTRRVFGDERKASFAAADER
jgi:hypothetical protein